MTDTIPLTIQVKYSCPLCGLRDVTSDVPARSDEDVLTWMDQTIRLLARDHSGRSPACQAKALRDLKIPVTNANRIGGATVQ